MSPKPNKALGQHWLNDQATLAAICDEAAIGANDAVLEIGPGLGTLTSQLTGRAKKVIAVEFDTHLAAELHQRVPATNLEVVQGDILHFNLATLPKNYKVVANLPYYITSKITRFLLEASNPPSSATLLVQKEVAERMAARPGDMSILAVAVQFYSQVRLGPVVPAHIFTPPPQVDSQVITLSRRQTPLFTDVEPKQFFRLVRAGFGEKRKKLQNALSGGLRLEKSVVQTRLKQADISPDVRAEDLGLEAWHKLYKCFF